MSKLDYLVSCIITTKDRPQLVVRAAKSVLAQTHRHIEVILVDDSQKGGSCEEVLRLGGNIKYIKNENPRGACYSRNVGLAEAKGDFIAFLDDDDYWMAEKLEWQLKKIGEYPLVSCDCILSYDQSNRRQYLEHPEIINYEDMLYHNHLGSCSFVLSQASAIKKCSFDENREAAQDWDMWLSVMQRNNIRQAYTVKKYLVDCSHASHPRISNVAKLDRALATLYVKNIQEYTPSTTNLFIVYNLMKANKSILVWVLKECIRYRLKNKGLFYFVKVMTKRLFGRIEMF